jgi:hypothetical protein
MGREDVITAPGSVKQSPRHATPVVGVEDLQEAPRFARGGRDRFGPGSRNQRTWAQHSIAS